MSLITKLAQIKRVLFWCVSLFFTFTSCSPNSPEQLNQLSHCTRFCCPLHLCYGLMNMSSLSSKITTLKINFPASHPPPPHVGFTQVPAEPYKGDTSSPEAATLKVSESAKSLPASILVSFLQLPLTLIQHGQIPWPKQQESKKTATAQATHSTPLDLSSAVHKWA